MNLKSLLQIFNRKCAGVGKQAQQGYIVEREDGLNEGSCPVCGKVKLTKSNALMLPH